ncbi:MAG TPA: YciI family protein [Sphingobium sp.]|uniref:YciI family protein n=1 Tax=Sphingobium sp. TaxID=1912891 RepID=UPI002ED1BA86
MIIISSTYTAPLDQVDAIRPAHIEWLKEQHAAGHFHGWGRKTPPTGGVILAAGDRAAIEALAQTDPYILGGVARAELIEFNPAFLAPGLEIFGG